MLCLVSGLALIGAGQRSQTVDLKPDTWVATDGLGREVWNKPLATKKRTVGMFYFLSNHVPNQPIYDITKLLAQDPKNPKFGPFGSPHWWGEPWFGYYQSDDQAVIRKHMGMLANAGVDVIVFDNTNGPTYPDVYLPLCQVLETMKSQGVKAPQIAFFTGHGAWNTLENDLYSKGLYKDLWFQWKGKPLMMVHLEQGDQLPPAIKDNFSVRESWAWTPSQWFGDGHDKWPWLDNYPQHYGWHEDPNKPEEVAVETGQHATSSIGRSSLSQKEPPVDDQRLTPITQDGVCFAQQFERALQIDPEFIFITGWNEWTATRFEKDLDGYDPGRANHKGGSVFVDEYNAEFSRDIEPAKGLLQDDYYYQLVSFIRRYKGVRREHFNTAKTIDLSRGFGQWKGVGPEYLDAVGDPIQRDHPGWGTEHYVNHSGRNDIVMAKVAYDAKNVTFYVRTKDALTRLTDPSWMLLYLNLGGNYKKGWLGYDYVINRRIGAAKTMLEANVGGKYVWRRVAALNYRVSGSELMIQVPRKFFKGQHVIDFKWADNISQSGEASDFTLNGDVAPDDRFNYRAVLK